ncbi:hypothetical protein N7467_001895 [Penicillium canescens]|nr:hypothetical protein N7467_001895 [Penicillium canescens]
MSSTDRPVVRRVFTEKTHATSYPFISPLAQDLSRRHVLITGAAREDGVGYATATVFARAGASAIAVIDLYGVSDDIVSRVKAAAESVAAFKETVSDAFGHRLDMLVNNAAYQEPYSSILDADLDMY